MAAPLILEQSAASGARSHTGRAKLVFGTDPGGETFLREQFACYPFHLCRPHRFANDPAGMATLYLQSLAGGIYQGDRLSLSIAAEKAARTHVTTQASTIVQGMTHGGAEQSVTIAAAETAIVEYLPDITILFPNAHLASRVRVDLHPGALVLVSESFLCHDPQGEGRPFDSLLSEIAVFGPGEELLAGDRFQVSGRDFLAQISGISGANAALGAFYLITRDTPSGELMEALIAALDDQDSIYGGASRLPNDCGVWARLIARDGAALRSALLACWFAARRSLFGVPPRPRRK